MVPSEPQRRGNTRDPVDTWRQTERSEERRDVRSSSLEFALTLKRPNSVGFKEIFLEITPVGQSLWAWSLQTLNSGLSDIYGVLVADRDAARN